MSITDTLIWSFKVDTAGQNSIDGCKFEVMTYDSVIKVWKSSGSVIASAQSVQMKSSSRAPWHLQTLRSAATRNSGFGCRKNPEFHRLCG